MSKRHCGVCTCRICGDLHCFYDCQEGTGCHCGWDERACCFGLGCLCDFDDDGTVEVHEFFCCAACLVGMAGYKCVKGALKVGAPMPCCCCVRKKKGASHKVAINADDDAAPTDQEMEREG